MTAINEVFHHPDAILDFKKISLRYRLNFDVIKK